MVTKSLSPDKTSQNDSGEPLAEQLMDYRSLKKKNTQTPTGPRHLSSFLPFMICIFALVGCAQSNVGSPSNIRVHLQARDSLRMISRQYMATSGKIISFETHCCKLQNPAPIIHRVHTWILRVIGSPSTDSSVEAQEETRALWIFRTQSRMSLGSRTFLSAPLSPSWSLYPSVSLCPSYSRPLWILPTFCPPHLFSANVH